MDITLSHRFDRSVEDVWTMVHDPAAHVAKFEHMGHRDIEVLEQSVADDSLDITLRRTVEIEVPSVAKKFLTPTNTVTSADHWERLPDGTLGGRYSVDIKGVPVESSGRTEVVADGDGAMYTVVLKVKVKVPIIGERVAGALRPQLEKQVEAEFAACEDWLARP